MKFLWVALLHARKPKLAIKNSSKGKGRVTIRGIFTGGKGAPFSLREGSKDIQMKSTPWKINMEHNHGGLEDHFPF